MELLVITSIGLAAMFFALWPVMKGSSGRIEALAFSSNYKWDNLLQEKEEAVSAVKEIEFDYASGKLSSEDYSRLISGYEDRVIKLLKELDDYEAADSVSQDIEDQIRALRKGGGAKNCPQCENSMMAGYKFCPTCGTEMTRQKVDKGK